MTLEHISINMRIYLSLLFIALFSTLNYAQHAFIRNDTLKVSHDLGLFKHAWAGGANFVQISEIDLNFDNKKDVFLFDRSGNRIMCFLNNGDLGQTSYAFAPYLTYNFPKLEYWALLRDYNGDGKEDIFTSSNGGIKVYQNISTQSNGIQFTLVEPSILSNYQPNVLTLFVTPTDIPAIDDIDGDGDLDILTFSSIGSCLEYHQNQSMELYGNADSLSYKLISDNWGLFFENTQDNNVTLNDSCDNPEHIAISENIYLLKENEPGGQEDRHIGSTVTSFDIEGDGDKDLFLGDVSFTNLLHLINGGNSQFAQASAVDLYFPSYDNSVNIQFFPKHFFLDINNDSKPDMIIGSNAMLNGENFTGIHQYNNIGTLPNNTFDYIRKDFLQGDMIDVGDYALPTFFDYNNDGLLDIVIGNNGYYQFDGSYKSMLALFKNIGTATEPMYKLLTLDWCGLSTIGLNYMSPTFGDLDGDGKKTLLQVIERAAFIFIKIYHLMQILLIFLMYQHLFRGLT
ncbi:MAG: VCBS repeat-containing protein [Sphingobacteriales bacterium JAD_PAG50586_3]|nr:MAG: VCBS repeat-containing protein [Sphingobacteriales bacterium JAD_PAG50586_3]